MSKTGITTLSGLLLVIFSSIFISIFSPGSHAHGDEVRPSADKPGVIHDFVITGVVLNSGNARLVEQFVELLGKHSGYRMKARFVSSYDDLSDILRKQPDAIGWTCGVPFVQDRRRDGQQLIGVPLFNGKPLYYSLILAHRDKTEKILSDFRGQVLAYSDPRSNSGFIAPSYVLKKQGIDIKKHFRLLLHTGNHERSIRALLNGLADVAAVDEYVWTAWRRNNPQKARKLRVLQRLGPFPFTPVVAGRAVAEPTLRTLQETLTALPDMPQGRQLLQEFGLDGFVLEKPEFYQPIENMLIELNGLQH